MIEQKKIISVKIRRYRDKDDSGIGITNNGKLVIIKDMGGEAEVVAAEILRELEETYIAKRIHNYEAPILEKRPRSKSTKEKVYDYDDDDEYYDDDELKDEY